jgi:hypothetical protein
MNGVVGLAYINGIELNATEKTVRVFIERYMNENSVESAVTAAKVFSANQEDVRFTWEQMVMGDNA